MVTDDRAGRVQGMKPKEGIDEMRPGRASREIIVT
jgi:hypothetical protein